MNFKSSYIKLTLFYVLIVMAISVTFSIVLYNVSRDEIGRGLGHDNRLMREIMPRLNPAFPEFEQMRVEMLGESNARLRKNLVSVNLLILVLSAGVSYFLAKRTLGPIEEMVEAQNRFTSDASHELRTPLTAMKSEIEVWLRDKNMTVAQARDLFKSNLEEIGKLEVLSNALLKLAKYKEQTQKEFILVKLDAVINGAIGKVEFLAKEKKIHIESDIEALKLKGDRGSLSELFVILIENAVKYSPNGSKIRIEFKHDKNVAIFSVKDEGPGIDQKDLEKIFERFYRADQSRNKAKSNGYGLGLAIAKSIAELHGAKINVESELGKGSRFIVRFVL